MSSAKIVRYLGLALVFALFSFPAFGATQTHKKTKHPHPAGSSAAHHSKHVTSRGHKVVTHQSRLRAASHWNPWKEPTFADSTSGDVIEGEDPTVRRAAVEALGPFNGTVVVVDPSNGRILSMVNQKLALKSGFEPCSTIKVVAALAGLSEGLIDRDMQVRLYGRTRMTLTDALAHSNNVYFAHIGEQLGYEKITYYARMFGLGEAAGFDIPGEQPGSIISEVPKGGLGMMTSFGQGFRLTPLELVSLMSSVANGGTMYYLQYPRSQEEVEKFTPRIKRQLDIGKWIPEIKPGMSGAVEFGTARRASYEQDQPILGKTGTCTDENSPTHLGWFGSFSDTEDKKLAVVVLLTGGHAVSGPVAAGVAGQVYRNLSKENYFRNEHPGTPIALISTGNCCALKLTSLQ
jgi:cell division protein FtsI/penicillin-binding protein 2